MMSKTDFHEESRHLALAWFRAEFDVTPERWRSDVRAEFRVKSSLWTRRRLQRRADEVLHLARSKDVRRISRHQFFVLIETLRELSGARKDWRLALLIEGKNVRQT